MEILFPVAEEVSLAVIPIAKDEIVVEDEIRVVEEIDHHRRVVHRKKTRRRGPAIYVLAPDVEWRRNNRPGFPFDRLLRSTRNPDHRLALRSEEHTSELQSRGHLVCR